MICTFLISDRFPKIPEQRLRRFIARCAVEGYSTFLVRESGTSSRALYRYLTEIAEILPEITFSYTSDDDETLIRRSDLLFITPDTENQNAETLSYRLGKTVVLPGNLPPLFDGFPYFD